MYTWWQSGIMSNKFHCNPLKNVAVLAAYSISIHKIEINVNVCTRACNSASCQQSHVQSISEYLHIMQIMHLKFHCTATPTNIWSISLHKPFYIDQQTNQPMVTPIKYLLSNFIFWGIFLFFFGGDIITSYTGSSYHYYVFNIFLPQQISVIWWEPGLFPHMTGLSFFPSSHKYCPDMPLLPWNAIR